MLAVALVTLNRVDNPKYPDTICKVVYQPGQFSWTKNRQLLKQKINTTQWQKAKSAAIEAYMNRDALGSFLATHFHNATVNPGWKLKRVARIGGHTFYM
jgi:spore germination cell wall hydrolase CwlJ-like protein